MIGVSVYVLADTFFISLRSGADGITVLNLALPLYGVIFAIGSMIGVGSATRYGIRKAQGDRNADELFWHAIRWQLLLSLPFLLLGIVSPETWLGVMGGDGDIVTLGKSYVQIVLIGTPFFMMNYSFTSFARNAQAPTVAMTAALVSCGFNIVFDYIFIFPCGMGMAGAALATAMSPALSSLICLRHFLSPKSQLNIGKKIRPGTGLPLLSLAALWDSCKLGVSAFVGEMSSAVTTTAYNYLILGIAGNLGVAAYGIVANLSLVAMALFNGLAQGMQPLLSKYYGMGRPAEQKKVLRYGLIFGIIMETILIACSWGITDPFVAIFNSEGNAQLAIYAHSAMQLYFLGYLFAGINSVLVTYYAAIDRALIASVASTLRGMVAIIICAVIMSRIWGLNGIWLSFMVAEMITLMVILGMGYRERV